ncbi:uncharacterized protein JOD43_001257 [Pullulanibacillus pueri]|uniref:Phosphohydrolase n=1 Tax=Pullulanibacillus pueri TaxID=1437324 RepID=A0A8J2ZUG0_9BACL|nr:HD domain-containing protein [Pullulanibacillus pueri]MBM7681090.1 uncharacterized protein [Pullulanibacillus pueri]GGH77009.1 phosphohydrolase [Pullulanibacillus pueri]
MDNIKIIESAREFAKQTHALDSSGHDWWHVWRVAELAKRIAEQEGADIFICELAALLHDIADEKLNKSEAEGLEKVNDWLENQKIAKEHIEHILTIIQSMSFKGGGRPPMKTLEGKIVQDADRLDAIGAIGIARTFAYSGAKGQPIYNPEILPREHLTHESYRKEQSTAINHFYEKLLKLKASMNTPFARELAERRHNLMDSYLKAFFLEWQGKA